MLFYFNILITFANFFQDSLMYKKYKYFVPTFCNIKSTEGKHGEHDREMNQWQHETGDREAHDKTETFIHSFKPLFNQDKKNKKIKNLFYKSVLASGSNAVSNGYRDTYR